MVLYDSDSHGGGASDWFQPIRRQVACLLANHRAEWVFTGLSLLNTCTHLHTHTHTHTHTHIYIQIHTHTHTHSVASPRV